MVSFNLFHASRRARSRVAASVVSALGWAVALAACSTGCGGPQAGASTAAPTANAAAQARPKVGRLAEPDPKLVAPGEHHFRSVRQLTFGGENAEAYWSFSGAELIFQARRPNEGCDRIHRMKVDDGTTFPVSSGKGATTCSYFLPGDKEVVYASTHLGGDACPSKPDHSQGYVWALYPTYDIFRARADGSNLTRLTQTPGYDAEATVCAKNGAIVFTSVRDGDLELYRMDADGSNVKRLTHTPGYDGGAFFNADCTKIVWRASRPKPGKELADYQSLLARHMVRPTKLEIYVADADGSNATQVTYLDAASFAPFFHPSGKTILFSSNYGDTRGREFDIFSVGVDGTGLSRVTSAKGFDGFPMFSPDGKWLAFSSNRATPEGASDTNVFLAEWTDTAVGPAAATEPLGAPERVAADVAWLAAPERQGRGVGTKGLEEAGRYIEQRFRDVGLRPFGDGVAKGASYTHTFDVVTSLERDPATSLKVARGAVAPERFWPLPFSASGKAEGKLAFAGYGIVAPELGIDDYKGVDARGRIVVVRRFVPPTEAFSKSEQARRYGDLRQKAFVARTRGARALLVVDAPELKQGETQAPPEARPIPLSPSGTGDSGIPVVLVAREVLGPVVEQLRAQPKASIATEVTVKLHPRSTQAFNVLGYLPAAGQPTKDLVVVGAHYDHLGMGGETSLAPDKHEPHLGADDNASGTAVLMEVARRMATSDRPLGTDVLFIAFSGEEMGTLGSSHFVRTMPGGLRPERIKAMLNMDMVGRLRDNELSVIGADTAKEWPSLVEPACDAARVLCKLGGGGFGPSDHSPFYGAKVPVLHFFTGNHSDYHKPSDTADKLNAIGAAQVARIVSDVARRVGAPEQRLAYVSVPSPAPTGDVRSFHASLGTVPDYAGPPQGQKGVLLSGVRPGSSAEKGGLRRGDILVKLGVHPVGSVEDLMFVLQSSRPGETVTATVRRDGKETRLEVTFEESKRH